MCVYIGLLTKRKWILIVFPCLNKGLAEARRRETERRTDLEKDTVTVVMETGGVSDPETDRLATVKHPDSRDGRRAGE